MAKKKKEVLIEDLEIIDAGTEGVAIGKHENMVVFVPYAVPGEKVDVKAIKKRSYYHAKIVNIKTSSINRVEPLCRHFGECGGCKWQHMNYATQLYYKQKQVVDNFIRIGKFPFPKLQPIIPSANIYEYRNKIEYAFSPRRWLTDAEIASGKNIDNRALGFHIQGMFDRILDIEFCHLHRDIGNKIRNAIKQYAIENELEFWDAREKKGFLRNLMMRFASTGDLMLIVIFYTYNEESEKLMRYLDEKFPELTSLLYVINQKDNDVITDLPVHVFSKKEYITENMNEFVFQIRPHVFYQTNSEQALNLYNVIKEFANIQSEDIVYDLYTGTEPLLFSCQKKQKIVGIEYVAESIKTAKHNAEINAVSNVSFEVGDMAKVLTDELVEKHGKPKIIITIRLVRVCIRMLYDK